MAATENLWPRVRWMEAVWSSDLKPLQRLAAAVYADHAGSERITWVTLDRLCQRTGMSRDAANRALRALIDQGWLVMVEKGRQHRASRYLLNTPSSTGDVPLSSTPDGPLNQPSSTSPDTSSTSPDTSSTGDVLDPSSINIHIPLPPRAKIFADIIGWAHDDDRLAYVDAFLADQNVRSPKAWLTACHRNAELEPNYLRFVQEQALAEQRSTDPYYATMPSNEEIWANNVRLDREAAACPDCDPSGWINTTDDRGYHTTSKCTHPNIRRTA